MKTEEMTFLTRHNIGIKKSCLYIEIMFEVSHRTPCQASPHGSPAAATHPGSFGEPNAAYKLLIAATMLKQHIETYN